MPSVTTWRRLEPRTRSEAMTSLAARVADPLWMVARQWQSGELTGSDTGSPVLVRLAAEASVVTRWSSAEGTSGEGNPCGAGEPVDHLVTMVTPGVGLVDRARGGRYFVRLLGARLAQRYARPFRDAFSLPGLTAGQVGRSDDHSLRWSRLLAGRAVDGAALRAALGPSDALVLPAEPMVDAADTRAVLVAAGAFVAWWDAQFAQADGTWVGSRLAAPFRLAASTSVGTVALVAPEYGGGRMDWHTFDVEPGGSMAAGDQPSSPVTTTTLPTRVAFSGMPASRWWQFEDAVVDLGRLDVAPDDLGRLLLAEFALVYGGDFFAVPLAVPVGSFTRITSLGVETCFGETVTVPSSVHHDGAVVGTARWRMFHCDAVSAAGTTGAAASYGLFVPPAAVDVLESEDLEDVLIARDEAANVAWAIERRVRGPWGSPVERREVEQTRRARLAEPAAVANELHYRLSTTMPDSWLPLVPDDNGRLTLHGAAEPGSRLLGGEAGAQGFVLGAAELPRTGRRVTLHARRARTADGTVRLWWAQRVRPGRGESSGGLQFDVLTHEQPG